MIKESFMKLYDWGWNIPSFNLINYSLIIFRETIKNEFNLILVVNSFSQYCKLVKSSRDIDIKSSMVFLLPIFELSLQLPDMSAAGFSVGGSKSAPDFWGCSGAWDQRLQRWWYSSYQDAIYERSCRFHKVKVGLTEIWSSTVSVAAGIGTDPSRWPARSYPSRKTWIWRLHMR